MSMLYGIVADHHAPRRDGGVPTFWDGWYTDRFLAEEVLALWKKRWPGARIYLVARIDTTDATKSRPGAGDTDAPPLRKENLRAA
jgi:hypothetical protein